MMEAVVMTPWTSMVTFINDIIIYIFFASCSLTGFYFYNSDDAAIEAQLDAPEV